MKLQQILIAKSTFLCFARSWHDFQERAATSSSFFMIMSFLYIIDDTPLLLTHFWTRLFNNIMIPLFYFILITYMLTVPQLYMFYKNATKVLVILSSLFLHTNLNSDEVSGSFTSSRMGDISQRE